MSAETAEDRRKADRRKPPVSELLVNQAAQAELAALDAERFDELEKANVGLAQESLEMRHALMRLLDMIDIEWEDLPEAEFSQYQINYDAALTACKKYHENEMVKPEFDAAIYASKG